MQCRKWKYSSPGDIFDKDSEFVQPVYFDVFVMKSLQPNYTAKGAHRAGYAAEAGEMEKDTK